MRLWFQVLHASLGTTEFFEFVLRNPYNSEHTVAIDWNDDDLASASHLFIVFLHDWIFY